MLFPMSIDLYISPSNNIAALIQYIIEIQCTGNYLSSYICRRYCFAYVLPEMLTNQKLTIKCYMHSFSTLYLSLFLFPLSLSFSSLFLSLPRSLSLALSPSLSLSLSLNLFLFLSLFHLLLFFYVLANKLLELVVNTRHHNSHVIIIILKVQQYTKNLITNFCFY